MTDHIEKLEKLIAEYEAIHGEGKGWEIFGALLISHGIDGQIKVFRKAKGRQIIVEPDPDALDAVIIQYR